jgi:hypothetical protein
MESISGESERVISHLDQPVMRFRSLLGLSLYSERIRNRGRPPHQRSITSCWRFRTSLLRSRSTAIF